MGKDTDKLYITMNEWANDFGGAKKKPQGTSFKPLPFNCCSLSFLPFEDPVCTPSGVVYDILNIVPFIQKYKTDPVTGAPLTTKDLVKLHFHKNNKGEYHCPVTYKVFGDFSHIVAIKTSGNVYSFDAIDELNLKAKNFKDLLTGEAFKKDDIITLQDPKKMDRRNMANAWFVKQGLDKKDEASRSNIRADITTKRTLEELEKSQKEQKEKKEKEAAAAREAEENADVPTPPPQMNIVKPVYVSSGFTSTSMPITAANKVTNTTGAAVRKPKKKGYAQIQTNFGNVNIELHCDLVPMTCENFIGLCDKSYYKGVLFHRLKPGFMIQGGDPTGTGRGGESLWKKPFPDEFVPQLSHCKPGVVSMANSGPNTNGSQFFITFKPTPHLDNKHAVFGTVVGGMETLKKMESVVCDNTDKPLTDIKILDINVIVNPFLDMEKEAAEEAEKQRQEAEKKSGERGQWFSNPGGLAKPKAANTGVGRYLGGESAPAPAASSTPAIEYAVAKKRPVPENFDSNIRELDDVKTSLKARKPKLPEAEARY